MKRFLMIFEEMNNEAIRHDFRQDGLALQYASEQMKNNEAIVMAFGIRALQYTSDEMENIILEEQERFAFQHASEEMKNNEGIALAAMPQDGLALQHAAEEMTNN